MLLLRAGSRITMSVQAKAAGGASGSCNGVVGMCVQLRQSTGAAGSSPRAHTAVTAVKKEVFDGCELGKMICELWSLPPVCSQEGSRRFCQEEWKPRYF